MTVRRSLRPASLVSFLVAPLLSCGGGSSGTGGQAVSVSVAPQEIEIAAGATAQFTATVTGTADLGIVWQMVDVGHGTIDGTGLYTAPASPGTYRIKASSSAAPGAYAIAAAVVYPPGPVAWPPVGSSTACRDEPLQTANVCGSSGTDPCPVFYACDCQSGADSRCVAGDDANAGTSPGAPLRTEAALRSKFGTLPPGGTVAFCRGGVFATSGGNWIDYACRAANPCIIRDYDPPWDTGGTAAKARLAGGMGFDGGGHREGVRVLNLYLQSSTPGSGVGVFLRNDIDDLTLCNMVVDGFNIGVQTATWTPGITCASTSTPPAGVPCASEHLRMIGDTFVNNASQGALWFSEWGELRDSLFANNGNSNTDLLLHAMYLSSEVSPDTGLRFETMHETVRNNEFQAGHDSGGTCRGSIVVVHGQHDCTTIDHNLFHAPGGVTLAQDSGCWGLDINPGSYSYGAGWYRHLVVRGNTVNRVTGVGIGTGSAPGAIIEDNLILQTDPAAGDGIMVGTTAHRTSPYLDDVNDANIVRNNTVYFGAGTSGTGITVAREGANHQVASNAVYYEGSSSTFACLATTLPTCAATFARIDHNLCYATSAGQRWEKTAGTLAQWQASASCPAAGVDRLLVTDQHSLWSPPQFVAVPSDFTPGSTSPLLDAADPAQESPIDLTGAIRDSAPDIGAYER